MKIRALIRVLIIIVLFVSSIPLILLQLQLLSTSQGTAYGPNLLLEHFTNESTIGYHGWWMSHARWGVASSCDSYHNNCPHAYTVQCKLDGIKCLHQFNVLSPHKIIRGFMFTMSYSTRYMEHSEVNNFIGAMVYIRLQDFIVIQKRFPLPTLDEAGELTETIDLWLQQEDWRDVSVVSVAVSLCCVGIEGLAKFWNVELHPIAIDLYPITSMSEKLEHREQYIMQCPKPLLPANPPVRDYSEEIILTPKGKLSSSLVTLVMQMSVDRINMLSLNAAVWSGPMSIVIYFPAKSASDTDHTWKRKYIEKKVDHFHLHSYTHLTAVYAHSDSDAFPINALRNLAMKHVYTDYMLLLDGDFIVSPHFEASFQLAVTQSQSLLLPGNHVTYVVPAFELVADKYNSYQYISPFYTKQELVSWVKKEDTDVLPFRSMVSPLAHYSTNYLQWYSTSVPYLVTDYRDKYEPYLVLRRTGGLPWFNEWFEDYGMNKVAHIMELWASGYQFVVLPDNWAIHVPHVETKYAKQFLMDLDKRVKNRILRFEFITNLLTKYKLDGCKV